MGWLKPAEGLLEPKATWETHRDPPPDGPVPEPEITALGQTVKGVRIGGQGAAQVDWLALPQRLGEDCKPCEMVLDGRFDFVPIALLLGVPLMFMRMPNEDGEDMEEIKYETKMYVYKLMTTPGLGLPLMWNQNGAGTKLPPVFACRSDGVPFTAHDWACLCEFHEYLDENYAPTEHLWYTNKKEFKTWVQIFVRGACCKRETEDPAAFTEIAPCFEHRYPIGIKLKAVNLEAKPQLNGLVGTVKKYDEAKLRVGVEFAPPFGLLSLKHSNLAYVDGGEERAAAVMKMFEKKSPKPKMGESYLSGGR